MPPLDSSAASPSGLTSIEARRLLTELGPNAMPDTAPPAWRAALRKFWAPVPWMLELAVIFQIALHQYAEGAVIAILLIFNGLLGFVQEGRAQATLDALKARLALTASVRRDGAWRIVPAADLVPGDVVKLSLGHVVAADVRLIEGDVLLDQSMLTGESLPIEASAGFETYAGALVRRGEAIGAVTATGIRTKFGRTAELVRTAHVTGSQQKAVLRMVRNLAMFNASIVVLQAAYAAYLGLPVQESVPLLLTAMLAAIPVALPASFTLAATLGARALARQGVLPTRLSAVDEAASMDLLCADKTGTLTQNELTVAETRAMPGFTAEDVLALAALASSDGGQDPVDTAIRAAATGQTGPRLVRFVPFDPARKMSEAEAEQPDGTHIRILKGAFPVVSAMTIAATAAGTVDDLAAMGHRVLAVAAGPEHDLRIAGLIALSDPPRPDSAALIARLESLGVCTVMVTGDATNTAATVASAIGLKGIIRRPDDAETAGTAGFAGVLPEDKFRIVQAFQKVGHVVGMCGDGANDAPALRQAQIGIAVASATDVAKSAAGIVLTEPGLGGIVAAVHEGRITFQRILTYCLRSMTRKLDQMLFLTIGLAMTGHAILTPLLMVLLMTIGDFLAMATATDNVRASPRPNTWRIDTLTLAGIIFATCNLAFCSSVLAIGKFRLDLDMETLRTLAVITLVFSGQAVMYVVRERQRIWSSRPSNWLMASSVADVAIVALLSTQGFLMEPLPVGVVLGVLLAAGVFALVLDQVKVAVFRWLRMVG